MIDRNKEIFLAKQNDTLEKLYVQDVRKAVAKKHKPVDEIAILRKMLHRVFDLVVELHGEEIRDEVINEFNEYFTEVEQIKSNIKEELGYEDTDI